MKENKGWSYNFDLSYWLFSQICDLVWCSKELMAWVAICYNFQIINNKKNDVSHKFTSENDFIFSRPNTLELLRALNFMRYECTKVLKNSNLVWSWSWEICGISFIKFLSIDLLACSSTTKPHYEPFQG